MPLKCECGKEHEGWVPQARLDEMAAQKRDALAKQTQLSTELTEAQGKAAKADTLTEQLAEWQTKGQAWATERSVMQAGISDAEGIEVASVLWDRVPADQRPEGGISAWLASEAAPKAVRAYLPEAASTTTTATPETTTATPETTTAGTGVPKANTGVVPAQPGGGTLDAERIAAMTPAEYAAHRESIVGPSV